MWWLREIFACTAFLYIQGDQPFFRSKRVYEIIIPFAFLVTTSFLMIWCPDLFPTMFIITFLSNSFQVMVFVVPFNLAALAVLSTFQNNRLDQPLPGNSAFMRVWSNQDNAYFLRSLSLRQYISLLFGYLCGIGMIFVVSYIFISSVSVPHILYPYKEISRYFIIPCIVFFIMHYSTFTLYAISFLFEKLNNNPVE